MAGSFLPQPIYPRCFMMKYILLFLWLLLPLVQAQQKIPAALKDWEDWALWDEEHRKCPSPYNDGAEHGCFWPSEIVLKANAKSGSFSLMVTVYHETWVSLPGDDDHWPLNVQDQGKPVAVTLHEDLPSVRLQAGVHRITGDYRWAEMPQKISIPQQYGVVRLEVEGKALPFASWDEDGSLWLKRNRTEENDKDFMGVQVYRLIEDGIPMWLETQVEISVSGKSREVELGHVIPEGWSLSSVDSQIPVAVDDQGLTKVQVRAGKWLVKMRAFRTSPVAEFRMKKDMPGVVQNELVAFKASPELRMVEIKNATPIDVTQTTFPPEWRQYPVYQWVTTQAITLEEKMRGSGLQSRKSLTGSRQLWFNEKGHGYIYQDRLAGSMQNLWRLDVIDSLDLGSVKINGEGQLITRNPKTKARGVELRHRNINLEAMGTAKESRNIPASGWNAPVDSLNITFHLPPGWRMLALFGAEKVNGDWLTSWTLLDLFILLIFSLSIFRLWGMGPGILAFVALGLIYHEPLSPRYSLLFLLIPLALLRVVKEEKARKWISGWKYIALTVVVLVMVPFSYQQIQSILYPQLEPHSEWSNPLDRLFMKARNSRMDEQTVALNANQALPAAAPQAMDEQGEIGLSTGEAINGSASSVQESGARLSSMGGSSYKKGTKIYDYSKGNLKQEAKARIQTGPGLPEWSWRQVSCNWSGPVSDREFIHPILIPPFVTRLLTLTGLILILVLFHRLLGGGKITLPRAGFKPGAAVLIALLLLMGAGQSHAEVPDKQTLDTLKARLMKKPDCFPNAAEIPSVNVQIRENQISFDARIDAAIETSVPLPGRLPSWSPVKVTVNGKTDAALVRKGGFLWVVVPAGVSQVHVEGMLPSTGEWEWSFQLKPRTVTVDAPGWNITGVKPDGTPETQIFFSRKLKESEKQSADYERREFQSMVVVNRVLEIGLTWQIHNTVTRLSSAGKAISLEIPLIPGEQILTNDVTVKDGKVEVRLPAFVDSFSWNSELTPSAGIKLQAAETDRWVEQWHLAASPIWNVELAGLNPVFESQEAALTPVWHPWPGESVTLTLGRPEAVNGPTMTIHRVRQETTPGARNRTTSLNLVLQSSVGDNLELGLPEEVEVTSVTRAGANIPVRRDKGRLVIPVQPGMQEVQIEWKEIKNLGWHTRPDRVVLPVDCANVTTVLKVPASRWILATHGPLRGPAVRFWGVLVFGLVVAWVLGGLKLSPLTRMQWALLMVGLTQIYPIAALLVVAWLFFLSYRGTKEFLQVKPELFNIRQIVLVILSGASLIIFLMVVQKGLLGRPSMFVVGNGSNQSTLNWFTAQFGGLLPSPGYVSVSIWVYRILMLAWALWLANSLTRWLSWGWKQFTLGGVWKAVRQNPPPIPK